MGNLNAVKYKSIFPLLKENIIWLGINKVKLFEIPIYYDQKNVLIKGHRKFAKMGNVLWFTNLEHSKLNEELIFYKNYNPEEYLVYDNCDAINVDKIKEIPGDYYENIGVPITIFEKYNPNQFDIIDNRGDLSINGKLIFSRIIIRRK